jgi:hypothetical protein
MKEVYEYSGHKVGDLLAAKDEEDADGNSTYVLGMISKIVGEKQNKFDILWVDGYQNENNWDLEQIQNFKQALEEWKELEWL